MYTATFHHHPKNKEQRHRLDLRCLDLPYRAGAKILSLNEICLSCRVGSEKRGRNKNNKTKETGPHFVCLQRDADFCFILSNNQQNKVKFGSFRKKNRPRQIPVSSSSKKIRKRAWNLVCSTFIHLYTIRNKRRNFPKTKEHRFLFCSLSNKEKEGELLFV